MRERMGRASFSAAWTEHDADSARAIVREASFVLRAALVLAFSYGLLNSVNYIPQRGATELLALFCSCAASAFFGIAPALALLLVLERHVRAAGARRWAALCGAVVLSATAATVLQIAAAVVLGEVSLPLDGWDWAEAGQSQLVWIILLAAWRETLAQRLATMAALHESELRSVDLQTRGVEAELQMLQAQIEP